LGITFVTPGKFQKQIEFLHKQKYKFVTLTELIQNYYNDPSAIAITFDDGYKNIFKFGFPILQKYNIPATVFVISSSISNKNNWDANLGWIQYDHLSPSEISKLIKAGWEIGSHSVNHKSLIGMKLDQIYYELNESKTILENQFKTSVNYFASPFGRTNYQVLEMAKKVGYKGICGFFPFKYIKQKPPREIIPRLAVYYTDSLPSIARKLSHEKSLKIEILKQNVINFCANATLVVDTLR